MSKVFAVGILYQENKFLAEKRKITEDHFPGAIIFPGGHIERYEKPEQALARELKEELNIEVLQQKFIGEFTYPDGAKSLTYLVTSWNGVPKPMEAESLLWIKGSHELTNELDREMLKAAQQALNTIN